MKTRIAALALTINSTTSEIQLFPAGEFAAVDGRPTDVEGGKWILTAELAAVLVAQVAAANTPFVIDYEHQTLRSAKNGQPAPASGWFSQVEWRDGDGLYAIGVEWTANASTMIAAKEYRFISPVFIYNARGEVCQLLHAALTNTPALDDMDEVILAAASRLASLSTETETTTVDEEQLNYLLSNLRWLLNLPETSTPEEVCAELQKIIDGVSGGQGTAAASVGLLTLLTQKDEQIASLSANAYDPAKHSPIEVVQDLQVRLAEASQNTGAAEIESLVVAALSDGRLLPSQETWARDYGKKDLAGLKTHLEKTPAIAALNRQQSTTIVPPKPEGKTGTDNMTPEQIAICNMFGNDPAEIAAQMKD
ncbi:phage protease [Enterobacter mori]|uniref:phage protease n=1 Tax=Enterobacter mori TaxID=539813 RepID=UPI003B83E551